MTPQSLQVFLCVKPRPDNSTIHMRLRGESIHYGELMHMIAIASILAATPTTAEKSGEF